MLVTFPARATRTAKASLLERRRRDLGPPDGRERRVTPSGRPTGAGMKVGCPFCGCSESAVVKSAGGVLRDGIRRRRECVECGRRFSTTESVDREGFERERKTRQLRATPCPQCHATTSRARKPLAALRRQGVQQQRECTSCGHLFIPEKARPALEDRLGEALRAAVGW